MSRRQSYADPRYDLPLRQSQGRRPSTYDQRPREPDYRSSRPAPPRQRQAAPTSPTKPINSPRAQYGREYERRGSVPNNREPPRQQNRSSQNYNRYANETPNPASYRRHSVATNDMSRPPNSNPLANRRHSVAVNDMQRPTSSSMPNRRHSIVANNLHGGPPSPRRRDSLQPQQQKQQPQHQPQQRQPQQFQRPQQMRQRRNSESVVPANGASGGGSIINGIGKAARAAAAAGIIEGMRSRGNPQRNSRAATAALSAAAFDTLVSKPMRFAR